MQKILTGIIAKETNLRAADVEGVLTLLDEGCTIPFIARYRKEKTGGMDEVAITGIAQRYEKLKELVRRKETVTKTITVIFTHQFCFTIHHFNGSFMARRCTKTTSDTLRFINFNYFSNHTKLLSDYMYSRNLFSTA